MNLMIHTAVGSLSRRTKTLYIVFYLYIYCIIFCVFQQRLESQDNFTFFVAVLPTVGVKNI